MTGEKNQGAATASAADDRGRDDPGSGNRAPAGLPPDLRAADLRPAELRPTDTAGGVPQGDLARTTLAVLIIGGLILGTSWVLMPFLGAFVWATMIVVATWPLLLRVERAAGGRRAVAVAVMTLALLALLIVPLAVAIEAVLSNAGMLAGLPARIQEFRLPPPPEWVAGLPVVGERVVVAWNETGQLGSADLVALVEPYAREIGAWLMQHAGGFATLMIQFLLIVVLAALLYARGETWAGWARGFGRRLAHEQGERMTVLAGQAIRGVALGVVVTALLQSLLGGIGLAIAGVPYAVVLTAVMFMLCIAQLGPLLVLASATVWVFTQDGTGWGLFMAAWTIVVGTFDNFLRPVLIRRGANLPLLLIFAGVIGGLLAFGIVGIFVGPVLLAVTWTLADDWVREGRAGATRSAPPP